MSYCKYLQVQFCLFVHYPDTLTTLYLRGTLMNAQEICRVLLSLPVLTEAHTFAGLITSMPVQHATLHVKVGCQVIVLMVLVVLHLHRAAKRQV